MKDCEFVSWMADRMVHVYGESPNVDFVHRARAVAVRIEEQAREIERLESSLKTAATVMKVLQSTVRQLKAQPSAMVLPEPMKRGNEGEYGAAMIRGYNACLREVARLNSSPASGGDERDHDTKGSRKALGAMNAKLRAKVGRLERELATVKQSLTVGVPVYQLQCREIGEGLHRYADKLRAQVSQGGEAVAWQARFIESGDAWDAWKTCSKEHYDFVKRCPNEWPDYEVRALYTHPADQVAEPDAELVELLRDASFAIGSMLTNGEWYSPEELKHRIDAKLASLK